MKVLLINNFHFRKGGSEAVYFNTAELLQKHGHEVCFFSMIKENNLPCKESNFFVSSNHSKSKINGMLSYFYNKDAAQKLEELIIQEKPDIAHVHLFWGGISPSIFKVLNKYKVPLIHTVHDYRMVCPAYVFRCKDKICEDCKGSKFYKCALKRCSKGKFLESYLMAMEMYFRNIFLNPIKNIQGFIFVSKFSLNKHILHNSKFSNTNSIVLYNYTKDGFLELPKPHNNYLLFFGRLSYEKGILTLLKALKGYKKTQVKLVGTGPLESDIKEYIKDNDLSHVELLGYKTGLELQTIIKNAKCVIVPSEWYENNPMTIIEAYSFGVPVIGSRIGGIPEIIKEYVTGFTFSMGVEKELTKAIEKLDMLSESEYQAMCKASYNFYQNNFSESIYFTKLITFYKKCIK